jgi:isoleucyl-tRNA synthetase
MPEKKVIFTPQEEKMLKAFDKQIAKAETALVLTQNEAKDFLRVYAKRRSYYAMLDALHKNEGKMTAPALAEIAENIFENIVSSYEYNDRMLRICRAAKCSQESVNAAVADAWKSNKSKINEMYEKEKQRASNSNPSEAPLSY